MVVKKKKKNKKKVIQKKKNKLVLQKPHFYDKYYIIEDYQYHHNYIHDNISDDIIKLYFTEAEKEIHRHWPNTKLVITVYPTFGLGDILCGVFNELKNENYNNVIYLDKIVDVNLESKEYLDDSAHPNAKAWEKIMPKLIDYLNI